MSFNTHDLYREFPEITHKINQLKNSDNYFRLLFDQYQSHNPISQFNNALQEVEYHIELEKQYFRLKEQLCEMLF